MASTSTALPGDSKRRSQSPPPMPSAPPAKRRRGRPRIHPRPPPAKKMSLCELPANVLELVAAHLAPAHYTAEEGWPSPLLTPFSVGRARITANFGQKGRQGGVPDNVRDLMSLARSCKAVRRATGQVLDRVVGLRLDASDEKEDEAGQKGKGKGKERDVGRGGAGSPSSASGDSSGPGMDEGRRVFAVRCMLGGASAGPRYPNYYDDLDGSEGSDSDAGSLDGADDSDGGQGPDVGDGPGGSAMYATHARRQKRSEGSESGSDEANRAEQDAKATAEQEKDREAEWKRRDELDDDSGELTLDERRARRKRVTMYIQLAQDTDASTAILREEVIKRRHQLEEVVFHKCPHLLTNRLDRLGGYGAVKTGFEVIESLQKDVAGVILPNMRRLRLGPDICRTCIETTVSFFLGTRGSPGKALLSAWAMYHRNSIIGTANLGAAAQNLKVLEVCPPSGLRRTCGHSDLVMLREIFRMIDPAVRKQLEALQITVQDQERLWGGVGPHGTCKGLKMKDADEFREELEEDLQELLEEEARAGDLQAAQETQAESSSLPVDASKENKANGASRARKPMIRPAGLSRIPERKQELLDKYTALAGHLRAQGCSGGVKSGSAKRADLVKLSSDLLDYMRRLENQNTNGKAAGVKQDHPKEDVTLLSEKNALPERPSEQAAAKSKEPLAPSTNTSAGLPRASGPSTLAEVDSGVIVPPPAAVPGSPEPSVTTLDADMDKYAHLIQPNLQELQPNFQDLDVDEEPDADKENDEDNDLDAEKDSDADEDLDAKEARHVDEGHGADMDLDADEERDADGHKNRSFASTDDESEDEAAQLLRDKQQQKILSFRRVERQKADLDGILCNISTMFPNLQGLKVARANGHHLDIVSGELNALSPVDEYLLSHLQSLEKLKWLDLGLVIAAEEELRDFPFGMSVGRSKEPSKKPKGKKKKGKGAEPPTRDEAEALAKETEAERTECRLRELWVQRAEKAIAVGDEWRNQVVRRMVLGELKPMEMGERPQAVRSYGAYPPVSAVTPDSDEAPVKTLPAGVRSGWVWMVDIKERGRKRGLLQRWEVQGEDADRDIKWGPKVETTL